MRRGLWAVVLVFFFFLAAIIGAVFEHELAHKRVYEYAGYMNNSLSIRGLSIGITNHDVIRAQDEQSIYESNVLNDIVGYNTSVFGAGIMMLLVMTLVFLIVRFNR
jgi:hypothetical protein